MKQQKLKEFNPYPDLPDDNPLSDNSSLKIFEGVSFWCGNPISKSTKYDKVNCCFNHIIGLPIKNGIEHPIYDYELEMQEAIESNQHVWIKKARGIGATEFLIRYLSWKALSSNDLSGKSVFIIAG